MEGENVFVLFKTGETSYPDTVFKTRELADKRLERIRRDYVQDELNGSIEVLSTMYNKNIGEFSITYIDNEYPFKFKKETTYQIYEVDLKTKED